MTQNLWHGAQAPALEKLLRDSKVQPGLRISIRTQQAAVAFLFYFVLVFFERERERQNTSRGGAERGGAEREGDPESDAGSRFRAVSTEPDAGLKPMNCEIMT